MYRDFFLVLFLLFFFFFPYSDVWGMLWLVMFRRVNCVCVCKERIQRLIRNKSQFSTLLETLATCFCACDAEKNLGCSLSTLAVCGKVQHLYTQC